MKNSVIEYLEDSVSRWPNKTCIADRNGALTFQELWDNARALACNIVESTNGRVNQPIPVCMEKSSRCIVAFMAIAMSGNIYVPIDMASPLERIKAIFSIIEPVCIVLSAKCRGVVADLDSSAIILEDQPSINLCTVSEVDFDAIASKIISTDPLYVLFTSGTTGVPKGVVISHRSVIEYTEWLAKEFGFNEATIFGNQAPFYFDNSILDIYSMLRNGSLMWIIPEEKFLFPKQLLAWLKDANVNTIFWVPSALTLLANSGMLTAMETAEMPKLEMILFCGEVMHNKPLNQWRSAYPNAIFANLYGPTEITDVCTYFIVNRPFADSDSLPIGFPCRNTSIVVLDENDRQVKGDGIGELCIRGECLSLGYYKDPQRSSEVFVQNPVNGNFRDLIYRTGDLVRYNEHNELMFLGRKDYQIKHMGHRIELGEIENACLSLSDVKSCCALYDEKNQKIILICLSEAMNSEKVIYKGMKEKIPSYMLPHVIHIVDDMPMNANGKIDRKMLRQMMVEN